MTVVDSINLSAKNWQAHRQEMTRWNPKNDESSQLKNLSEKYAETLTYSGFELPEELSALQGIAQA